MNAISKPAPANAACGGCAARPANAWIVRAIAGAEARAAPFRHWLIGAVLPPDLLHGVSALPAGASAPVATGRRDLINPDRRFIDRDAVAADPRLAALAGAFDSCGVRRTISALCGADLAGARLRIEHAVDRDGFWLEPHTDIGAKRLTMLVFLSDGHGSEGWGTDLYDRDLRPAARVPAPRNTGLLFVPGEDTWHGFERRPINGLRRSLIINYVDETWRARHELVRG